MPQWHELYLPKVRLTEIDDVPLVSLETRSLPPGSLEVKRMTSQSRLSWSFLRFTFSVRRNIKMASAMRWLKWASGKWAAG